MLRHLIITVILTFATSTVTAQEYDLVVLSGHVMDPETNLDAVRNVGVNDGRIAIITEQPITGDC